jgi:acylphosphatase
MTRYTIHFSGRVQGVGFRFRTREIARSYAVSGFVENLDDGRVRLVAEGNRDALDAFLKDLGEQVRHHVRDRQSQESPATGEFGTPGKDPLTIR